MRPGVAGVALSETLSCADVVRCGAGGGADGAKRKARSASPGAEGAAKRARPASDEDVVDLCDSD